VNGFQRFPSTGLEWTGLAYLDPSCIEPQNCHVYQILEPRLPLPACPIEALEIDTSQDLARANAALGASLAHVERWALSVER
jgi:hypothetical protein